MMLVEGHPADWDKIILMNHELIVNTDSILVLAQAHPIFSF